jgi:hypothetical protein
MSRKTKPPTVVSQSMDMTATRWRCVEDYGSCVGCDPAAVAAEPWGNAWTLRIPRIEDNPLAKIGYVLCPHTTPITATTLTGTFSLTAAMGTMFVDGKAPSDGVTPASFRFIIMTGLDGTSMGNEFGRWWSRKGIALNDLRDWQGTGVDGSMALTILLNPANWSSVYGKTGDQAPAEFAKVLASPCFVGLTVGAGGDYGHGAACSGGGAWLRAEGIRFV